MPTNRTREQKRKEMELARTAMLREILEASDRRAKMKAITMRNPMYYLLFENGVAKKEEEDYGLSE